MADPTVALPRALDCWGYPSALELLDAGYGAINAYIPFEGDEGKGINQAVLEDYTQHGVYVWFTWEQSANAPENGAGQAQQDFARTWQALDSLHVFSISSYKNNLAVYATNDAIVTNWSPVQEYFREWAALCVQNELVPGAYADDSVCNVIQHLGITRFWQTGAGSSSILPWAHLYQYGPARQFQAFGRTCDLDVVQQANYGGFNYSGIFHVPTPAPPPPPPKPIGALEMYFLTQNPLNNGQMIVDPLQGLWDGLDGDTYDYYKNVVGIKDVAQPPLDVFRQWKQKGTV